MKKLYPFFCAFLLMSGMEAVAATSTLSYIDLQKSKNMVLSDSLLAKAPIVNNDPASLSALSGLVGGVVTFAGIITLGSGTIAGIVVGGIFGILAIITGGIAIKKRRKFLETTYLQHPKARKLPLGQGRSAFGIFLGILSAGILVFLLGFIITYAIS